ncbi:uncharacterized protein LOC116805627 [Drosophila grimshawi]|uniref:uncharacterized protein LOC116805627 n=1 Tax=Drosophila grimshawi TaxID=7222 RepID=UPI000C86F185|nr:uncharacterized protein LOC116805627 [Drosophila grimshawi]
MNMMNSLISFKIRPALLVIIPVVLYSMLHASSYSLKLLDLIGQNRFVGHTVHHLYCGVPGGQRTEGHRLLRDLHYALHHCAHLHGSRWTDDSAHHLIALPGHAP